jgi:hypothetical protein
LSDTEFTTAKPVLPPHLRGGSSDDDAARVLAAHKERVDRERDARLREHRARMQEQRRLRGLSSDRTRDERSQQNRVAPKPWRVTSIAAEQNRPRPTSGGAPEPDTSEYAWDIWRGERY